MIAHQLLEVDAVEVLHRVIEHAVGRAAVVVDRDRVRMTELRGHLHLALEALEVRLARAIRRQQLDRGRPAQHRVAGAVDDAHAAGADLLLERVLAEPPRPRRLGTQAEDDV